MLLASTLYFCKRHNLQSVVDTLSECLLPWLQHDSSVASILCALEVYDNKSIPYSATVMVELHEHKKDEYSVQIWYRRDTHKPPVLLKVPGK